ncbi:hypothetical protein TrLO_g8520 [Triparma laevis f. longispina]|nr:hypothetical protein TrLO_g8520 [Triparma laevis f. longispina]
MSPTPGWDNGSMHCGAVSCENDYCDVQYGNTAVLVSCAGIFFAGSSFSSLMVAFSALEEKNKKLLSSLKRAGLSNLAHWFSLNISAMIISVPATALAVLIGNLIEIDAFTKTNPLIIFMVLLAGSAANTAVCLFITTIIRGGIFFSGAVAVGLAGALSGCIIMSATSLTGTYGGMDYNVYPSKKVAPDGLGDFDGFYGDGVSPFYQYLTYLMPWTHFARLFFGIFHVTGYADTCVNTRDFDFADLYAASESWRSGVPSLGFNIVGLIVDSILFTLLAFYVSSVRGSEDEHALSMLFIFDRNYWFPPETVFSAVGDDGDILRQEQNLAAASGDIRARKLTKSYNGGNTALKEVTIRFQKGECYALLGQNGAGKTTLISALTGATNPSHGDAFIGKYGSISKNMSNIQKKIGVCPQEDLIYEELSGYEHAHFYSLCRGRSWDMAKKEALSVLNSVTLLDHASKRAKDYSGGMKRRLMAGLATVGDPEYVFLDEPSTGLDPLSRRRLWSILESFKTGRVLVLTTHMMEEADVLGDKIGFLHLGRLRASGTPLELKRKLGTGFSIELAASGPGKIAACAAASALLPKGAKIDASSSSRSVSISCPRGDSAKIRRLQKFFEWIEAHPEFVQEVALSNSTLSEVFTTLVRHDRDEIAGEELGSTLTSVASSAMTDEEKLHSVATWLEIPPSVVDQLILDGITIRQIVNAGLHALRPELLDGANSVKLLASAADSIEQEEGGLRKTEDMDDLENALKTAEKAAAKALEDAKNGEVRVEETDEGDKKIQTQKNAEGLLDLRNHNNNKNNNTPNLAANTTTDASFPKGEPSRLMQIWAFFMRDAAFETKRTKKGWAAIIVAMVGLVITNVFTNINPTGDIGDGDDYYQDDSVPDNIYGYVDMSYALKSMLLMWATTLLQPNMVFVFSSDRRDGHRQASFLLSCNNATYWVGNYMYYTLLALALMLVYTMIGYLAGQDVYTQVPVGIYFLLYCGGALSQVTLAVFFSVLLPGGALMSLVTILLLAITPLVSFVAMLATICMKTYDYDQATGTSTYSNGAYPNWLMMIPPFSYGRAAALSFYCANSGNDNNLSDCGDGTLAISIGYLWLSTFLLAILSIYLHAVLPSPHGVSSHPFLCLKNGFTGLLGSAQPEPPHHRKNTLERQEIDAELRVEDSDVILEKEKCRRMVDSGAESETLLLTHGVKKRYGKLKPWVVNGVSVSMDRNEVFCLLGPNGAGKTTLFSLLTTMISHNTGSAFLSGVDVSKDPVKVREKIGVCPQHDVLYPNLSVREHLEFACRARGVRNPTAGARRLAQTCELDGDPFNTPSSALSGGMRRRLSIAISVAGSPEIVFMDEPTTGLDPETRYSIWSTIRKLGKGRLLILSTHSMEEAESLSSRIGIMNSGKMLCLGDPVHLKTKFGRGLRVRVVLLERGFDVLKVIQEELDENAHIIVEDWPKVEVQLGAEVKVSKTFEVMERIGREGGSGGVIRDWEICHTSLEEVFIRLVEAEEN